jgi:predicted XRE-type DNA-binding protein
MGPERSWADLYEQLYDADEHAEIEQLKPRLLSELKAHRLAQAGKGRNLTQRDAVAAMGVSAGRVSPIKRGEVACAEVLDRYAKAVGGRFRVVIEFGDELMAV